MRIHLAIIVALCMLAAALCVAAQDVPLQPRATLVDSSSNYRKGHADYLRWRTHWQLTWTAMPRAQLYEIEFSTSEGVSAARRTLREPRFTLEVAKGDNPRARGQFNRELQLAAIRGLLAVRVIAKGENATELGASPWLPVGSTQR